MKAIFILYELEKVAGLINVSVQTAGIEHGSVDMRIAEHSLSFGYTLLECEPHVHPWMASWTTGQQDHLRAQTFIFHDASPLLMSCVVHLLLSVCLNARCRGTHLDSV